MEHYYEFAFHGERDVDWRELQLLKGSLSLSLSPPSVRDHLCLDVVNYSGAAFVPIAIESVVFCEIY